MRVQCAMQAIRNRWNQLAREIFQQRQVGMPCSHVAMLLCLALVVSSAFEYAQTPATPNF